MVVNMILNYLF